MTDESDDTLKIRSNNPPLASYTRSINTTVIDISTITKILIYSDGLNENFVKESEEYYGKYLPQDFKEAQTLEELEEKREAKIALQEDDVTYIHISLIYSHFN